MPGSFASDRSVTGQFAGSQTRRKRDYPRSLLLTTSFPPRVGGRELYLHSIFSRLPAEEVRVLAVHEEGDAQFDRKSAIRIRRVPRERLQWFLQGRRKRLRWFASLAGLGWREKVKVVHCGVVLPDGMSGWLLKKVLGWPYIVYTYAKEVTEPLPLERLHEHRRRVLIEADRVVTISRYTRQELIRLGVDPARIVMVYPGVDAERFRPDPEAGQRIRALYGLGERPVLLTVARLIPRKGHDMVIAALPSILQQVPEAVYVIVGSGPDEGRLRRLAEGQGVADRVLFAGAVPDEDLPAWYNAADLLVMPNREEEGDVEGFGIVFLEANACATPVIGGRSGGAVDAVADGETGYLVDPASPEAVAEAAVRLLTDPALARRMGERGRERARREFSWERAARQVRELTAEVMAAARGRRGVWAYPVRMGRSWRFFLQRL